MRNDEDTVYTLIHSPLVGGLTWTLVAQELSARGYPVAVPHLADQATSPLPLWQQQAESVAQALDHLSPGQGVVLVAHSGAGPLLPAISQALNRPVQAYVFVDAGLPRDGASRLDLMVAEDPDWAAQFHQKLRQGHTYPTWTEADLVEIIPDAELRRALLADLHPRGLPFYSEPLPVFAGWPEAPCAYLKLSGFYDNVAAQARQKSWLVREIPGAHFQMLVEPVALTELLLATVKELIERDSPFQREEQEG